MKRVDLKIGDRVWIVLPYSGGRGYATIVDLDVRPSKHERRTQTIRVKFDRGHSATGEKNVTASSIIRREES